MVLLIFYIGYGQDMPKDIPQEVDIGVNGILISDTLTVKRILGHRLNILDYSENTRGLHINFTNRDTTELLIMILHEGSYQYEFSEFVIRSHEDSFNEEFDVFPNSNYFKTFKGLRLGIDLSEFKKRMGDKFKEYKNENESILKYDLVGDYPNFGGSSFLKFYNMPCYYGEYFFEKNKLVLMKFGFSYP